MIRLMMLLVLFLPVSSHADDRMGRLFLSPAERANLDYLRKNSKPPERVLQSNTTEASEDNAAQQSAPPAIVTIQGYVKRSDGKGTVWVNRQPVQEKSSNSEVSVGRLGARGNRVEVKLPGSSKPVSLKAGQSYDPASGMIADDRRQLPVADDAAPAQAMDAPAATPAEPQNKP